MNIKNFIDSYLNHYVSFQAGAIGSINRGAHDLERFRRSRPGGSFSKKDSKILIAVPSHAVKGPGMQEVSHAYQAFSRAGYDVDFVTADGSPVQFSQSDLTDPVNRWFVENANARYSVEQPLKAEDIDSSRYAAVYFAVGNGLIIENHWFRKLSEQILNNSGIVAGSGDMAEAVNNLKLNDYINSGYSAPTSEAQQYISEYGSVAARPVAEKTGWMIRHNNVSSLEEESFSGISEQIVMSLSA